MATLMCEAVLRSLGRAAGSPAPTDSELLDRFGAGDEEAFITLVRRHSGLVLGVCRRALPTVQDAEDACQATFLVLAQKAKAGRWQTSIANWLFTTARLIAAKASRAARRRRRREVRPVPIGLPSVLDQMTEREAFLALDEELDRLPTLYREPLILRYLQGLTRYETAARLGISVNTLKSRLDRGRKRLAHALTQRGIALGTGLLTAATTSTAWASSSSLRLAILTAARGAPSPTVAALARGIAMTGLWRRGLAVLALVGFLALGLAATTRNSARPQGNETPTTVAEAPADERPPVAYSGLVLGPDGKPVSGATVHLASEWEHVDPPRPAPVCARSGADGQFAFTAPKGMHGGHVVVAAAAANLGPGWLTLGPSDKTEGLTIPLVVDEPIAGQVVDLEGKPVRGATVSVLQLNAAANENLGPWLVAVRDKKGLDLHLKGEYLAKHTTAFAPKATTDADGRFRLDGLGRDRLVTARLDGPTVASEPLHILTRPGKPLEAVSYEGNREYNDPRMVVTYYGSQFRHAAPPTRPVVGVVRDRETKVPLPGVLIRSHTRRVTDGHYRALDTVVQATTDAQGRYRLIGLPKGIGYTVLALPTSDQPYVVTHQDVPDGPGFDPVTVDFEWRRGVWIEGRITDKGTGKPVRGMPMYFAQYDNPNLRDYPGFEGTFLLNHISGETKEDGAYRIVGLPGPGLVVCWGPSHYLRVQEREDEFGLSGPEPHTAPFQLLPLSNYGAFGRVDPPKGATTAQRDVTLDPGWTVHGTFLGPDNKPLSGVEQHGTRMPEERDAKPATFAVRGYNPKRPRDVYFRHREKGLVGVLQQPKHNGEIVEVRMEPGAAVVGRLVDTQGRPRPDVALGVTFRSKVEGEYSRYTSETTTTDKDGRFRIDALVPAFDYRIDDGKGDFSLGSSLRPRETKDLGDVRLK